MKIIVIEFHWNNCHWDHTDHFSHIASEVLDKGDSCGTAPACVATFQVNAKCESLFIHFASQLRHGAFLSPRLNQPIGNFDRTSSTSDSSFACWFGERRELSNRYVQFAWQLNLKETGGGEVDLTLVFSIRANF